MIGNVEYQCSCVRYVPRDHITKIISLSVTAALLLAVIIVIVDIIVLRRRRHIQLTVTSEVSEDNSGRSAELNNINNYEHYTKQLPDSSESHV